MTKIRVLFLVGSLASGGSERQVVETLKGLDRNRFGPLLYTTYREGELLSEVPPDVPIYSYWDRFALPKINWPGRIRGGQAKDVASILAKDQIQVIYERNFPMTLLGDAACRIRPTRRIAMVSSDPVTDFRENAGKYPGMKRWLLKHAYRRADRVVAVSDGVAASVRKHYQLPNDQVLTIYNSIDPDRIARLASEYQPDLPRDGFHIVSVGRLIHGKGYHFLVEAMHKLVYGARFTQLSLWLIGEGPFRRELERLIRYYNLVDHVHLVGFVQNPIPYLKAAQLFCLPSLYEGMPNALLEAILCNTPVLACDCPSGPAEILDKGQVGHLIPAADPDALANAIAQAVSHYERWQSLTQLARAHVLRHFARANTISRLETLIEQVAQHGPGTVK